MNIGKLWSCVLYMCVFVAGDDVENGKLGGADVSSELYPFLTLVIIEEVLGTGVIVSPKWVLTINQWRGKESKVNGIVKAGSKLYNISSIKEETDSQIRKIKQAYKSPYEDLIGSALLLLLEKHFLFGTSVQAALFTRNRGTPEKDTCVVAGFGGEGNGSHALLSGSDWPLRRCDNGAGMGQLCSPFGPHGVPCSGDYGAPAVCGACVTGLLLVPHGFGDCRLADSMEIYWSLLSLLLWTCTTRFASVSGEVRDKRMVNGSLVSNEKYPFVVKVFINGENCTGFILDKRFVATARLCIGDFQNRKYNSQTAEIYAGFDSLRHKSDYKRSHVQRVKIISAFCYSEDNKDFQLVNDLCLVKVFPRFEWTRTVKVAKLPSSSDKLWRWPAKEDRSCVLASYGKGSEGDGAGSLRAATLRVRHPRRCASLSKSRRQFLDRVLCSEAAPCVGDTGAPLVCGRTVVAILRGRGNTSNVDDDHEEEVCGEAAAAEEVTFVFLPRYLSFIETVLWSQPDRFRVRVRGAAVSCLGNYFLIPVVITLGKLF